MHLVIYIYFVNNDCASLRSNFEFTRTCDALSLRTRPMINVSYHSLHKLFNNRLCTESADTVRSIGVQKKIDTDMTYFNLVIW